MKGEIPKEKALRHGAGDPNRRPGVLIVVPYMQSLMEKLAESYEIHRLWETPDRAAFLAERASRIRAILTVGSLGAKADLIDALPNLEIICCNGVGTDAIDLAAARKRGIPVTNTPDVLTGDVADLAVGLALAVMRRIPAADAHVRSGAWAKRSMGLVTRFYGKRVGVAGFGRIGMAVARRLSGFDAEVGYFDVAARPNLPHVFFNDLVALAAWSDVLIVTLSGGPSTWNIVNARVFEALGPEGFFINVSRGLIVDEPALLDALENRRIAGAGLDVFWNEPNIDRRFLSLDNVVLHPHLASGTVETRTAMAELVLGNLAAHFSGRPLLTPVG